MKTLNILVCTLCLSTLFYSCDKNEFAPYIVNQEFSIEENSPTGTIIGAVDASDEDEDQKISFEITDGNLESTFEINPSNGIISIASPTKINYEENTEFMITVVVTDNHDKEPLASSAIIKINVTDENEFPPIINNQNFRIDENPINGQEIGLILAIDGDIHQSLTFSIVGTNEQGYFKINSQTGILSVNDSLGFDYESTQLMSVLVKVSDNHTDQMADSATISITIQDVGIKYEIVLQPGPDEGKDSFIEDYPYGDYRNRSFGDSEEFSAISWTSSGTPFVTRSFIDFNITSIPENAFIDSAKISLFAHGNTAHGFGHDPLSGSNEFYLQRVITSWEENSVTWNNQPECTTMSQKTLPESTIQFQDYYRIDITDLVKDMHETPSQSFGLMLSLITEEGFRRVFFASSDVIDESKRPKLEIYYSIE